MDGRLRSYIQVTVHKIVSYQEFICYENGHTQALTEKCIVRLSRRKGLEVLLGGAVVPVVDAAVVSIGQQD